MKEVTYLKKVCICIFCIYHVFELEINGCIGGTVEGRERP